MKYKTSQDPLVPKNYQTVLFISDFETYKCSLTNSTIDFILLFRMLFKFFPVSSGKLLSYTSI